MRSILLAATICALSCFAAAAGLHETAALHELKVRATSWTSPNDPQQTGTVANCDLWYDVVSGDTCATIESAFGITLAQFLAWNPAVSSDCSENFWAGYAYCVGVSSHAASATQTTSTERTATAVGASTPAGPTFSDMPCTCNKYYTVVSGDTCPSVETMFGITPDQFFQWNPTLSTNCETNFWVGASYCVGVSGATSCPSPSVSSSAIPTTAGPSPASPTFPGIPCQCDLFYEVAPGDTCGDLEEKFDITSADFLEWNPSVDANCTLNFYIGYSYCVGVSGDGACPSTSASSTTNPAAPYSYYSSGLGPSSGARPSATSGPGAVPSPIQSGTPSTCHQYYQANPMDTCASIEHRFSHQMTEAEFFEWNPAVGTNCTSLYVNYYYCVSVPVPYTSLPNATSQYTVPAKSTLLPSTATSWNLTSLSALQTTFTGAATGCPVLFPAPMNTTCDELASIAFISEQDIEDWNTGINCTGTLEPSELLCIANPTSSLPSATATSTPTGNGPQPQQSGIVSDCSQYWFVGTSDNCTTIVAANDITEAELEAWNPALGSNCTGLKASYFICVDVLGNGTVVGQSTSASVPLSTSSTSHTVTTPASTSITTLNINPTGISTSQTTVASSQTVTWATPTPTQKGMVAGCSWFYLVQGGNDCYDIAQEAEISLDSLYSMNPALGSSCTGLLAGYYICLGTSTAPKTVTSGVPVAATPAPVQTGMISDCTRFYLVEGGDTCDAITVD
ncbi:hypothetical protein TsFJ059_000005, partial [Trichoderma semiorbis]